MNKLKNPTCDKCGEEMTIRFVKSTGMDIGPTGMFADCGRCGFSKSIRALDDKDNRVNL